ncbi:serine hydrolase [Patescibacteria group bacterium]|nr:serine hydrolase [Patescibacteria group bacterium]
MNEDQQDTTPDAAPATGSEVRAARFPVTLQLGLLGVFLVTLFTIAGGTATQFMRSLKDESLPKASGQASPAVALTDIESGPFEVPNDIALTADSVYVWDVVGKRVLYEKNGSEVLPLASITKLMTALIAYELVDGNTRVTIPGTAAAQESASGLASGEVFNVRRLADLALIASANDAAYSLASAVGALLGGDEATAQFVAAMNIRAKELGLSSLDFKNTTGLDLTMTEAGAYGTARDVTFLMEYILTEHPALLESTTESAMRVYNDSGDFHDVENTNVLIGQVPNLIGSKTGYTDLAGGNLTVAFDTGFNRPVIITVLSSSQQGRFADVAAIVDAVQTGKGAE